MRKIWKEKWFWKDLTIMFCLWVITSAISLFQIHHVGLTINHQLVSKVLLTYLSVTMIITVIVVMIDSTKNRER